MKRRPLLIAILTPVLLVVIAILSGMLQWYVLSSQGNEPAIESGEMIFATNLKSPKKFDFVCFEQEDQGMKQTWVFRICALGGDTVEFIDGVCYVNGENQDEELTLQHQYLTTEPHAHDLIEKYDLTKDEDYFFNGQDDTVAMHIKDHIAALYPALIRTPTDYSTPEIQANWNNPQWTPANFGPITVPENHYFLIGDNREMARDSRYIGTIAEEQVKGVVF